MLKCISDVLSCVHTDRHRLSTHSNGHNDIMDTCSAPVPTLIPMLAMLMSVFVRVNTPLQSLLKQSKCRIFVHTLAIVFRIPIATVSSILLP